MDNNKTNLYSREIFTYGKDTVEKIINLKILIYGLRGLGVEIAKNLILSGPKEISIFDDNICIINDLTSNFYLEEKDINKQRRDEACLEKLSALNPYVKVKICKEQNLANAILNYNCIIITEIMKTESLFKINEICRENNIGFIYTGNLGLIGFAFIDFGKKHIITNENGNENVFYYINSIIKKEKTYEISIDNRNNTMLSLNDNDYVKFKGIKGLDELNNNIPKKIKIISPNIFSIENNDNNKNKYINGGIVEEVKMPIELNYLSLKEQFYNPYKNETQIIPDKSKINENELIHCGIVALHQYYDKYNKLPELNDIKESNIIIDFAKKFYENAVEKDLDWIKIKKKNKKIKIKYIPFNEDYILKIIRWSKSEISPICSFLGGIVSQESFKIIGKYKPINQWIKFDFFEVVKDIPENCDRTLLNCRYDDQIAIFGKELQNKLSKLNIFMIGAGALGCEYLKNFALMGLSTSKNKKISITDNDNIEISNLSRQFLFRNSDIGKSKSFCACREIKKINKFFNCYPLNELVNEKTNDIFTDEFWENNDIIIAAVDNLKARKFIGRKIIFYSKPFIDSGTHGTKGTCDLYYPGKTVCFDDIPIKEKKEIPMCTLKQFPSEINHCIEWSKIKFEELFKQSIKELKMLVNEPNQFFRILDENPEENENAKELEKLKYFIDIIICPSKNEIIKFCRYLFEEYYNSNIKLLLSLHPEDNIDADGKLFWSGAKRLPHPLDFDINEKNTLLFIKSIYNIISQIINFNMKLDDKEIIEILTNQKFEIKSKQIDIMEFKNEYIPKLNDKSSFVQILKEREFEKNNDYDINFILSTSNLRAINYDIEECDFLKAQEISGNIVPAVATSTACITGLACLQIYNLVQSINIENTRCSFIDLADSEYDFCTPEGVRYFEDNKDDNYKVIPQKFSVWDYIEILGPKITVGEIVDYYKEIYEVDIDYINSGNSILAIPFEGKEEYSKTIEELYEQEKNIKLNKSIKYIELSISGTYKNKEIRMPNIKYLMDIKNRFKKLFISSQNNF